MIIKINGAALAMDAQPTKPPGFVESVKGFYQFLTDWQHNGTWHAFTGEYFLPWLDARIDVWAIVLAMVAAAFGMFGSKLAWRIVYWDVAAYIILKSFLGVVL